MAEILLNCPKCGNKTTVRIGQVETSANLAWFRSWNCNNCGFTAEESGDEAPDDIREKLIEEGGTWILIIEKSLKKSSNLKLLKKALGLTIQDISRLQKDDSGKIIYGTKREIEFYQKQCREQGLELSMQLGDSH